MATTNTNNGYDFISDFQNILNGNTDYLNKNKNYQSNYTNNNDYDTDDDFVDKSEYDKLKQDYDNLQKEFMSYKNRIDNSIDKMKKSLLKESVKSLIDLSEFVRLINNGKQLAGIHLKEDDMIMDKIKHILEHDYHVVPMNTTVGIPFNYNYHYAIAIKPSDIPSSTNTITQIYSDGYIFKDDGEVIEHARVAVSDTI